METVKIKLTQQKVQKLIDRIVDRDEYVPRFNGFFTKQDEEVMKVVDALRQKITFDTVNVVNKRLMAANYGMPRTISTFFIDKGIKTVFDIELDGVKLELTYNEQHNAVELWWMEVTDKNKGRGSEIMNLLLDTVEELGMRLYLTPVPFSTGSDVDTKAKLHKAFFRLRNWYESFGFERIGNDTPSLIFA